MTANLTERQQKWFASVKASLERDTGRPLDAWVEIVRRDCPETERRKQEAWLKATYGMSIIRAGQIIHAVNPEPDMWDDPEVLRAALWKDPAARDILIAFEALIIDIADVIPTQRKGYSAWSRTVQFAALKPLRGGKAMLGLAIAPESDARLAPARKDSWSERLKSTVTLARPADLEGLLPLVEAAWQRS